MKQLLLLQIGALLCIAAGTNGQSIPAAIFTAEDQQTPENFRLVWSSKPGLLYEVRESTNLQSWTTVSGFPTKALGPAQQWPFATAGNARFFQVRELDDRPPAILFRFPADDAFAVPRFASMTVELSDANGIDTNSVQLTVGSLGTFTLSHPNLNFSNHSITFNGGGVPLGDWGSDIQAILIVADLLGNVGTNTWRFKLEIEPQVVTNLFVFGSPHAQGMGQQIGSIPTAALGRQFAASPPVRNDPWTLELVESNRLELSYLNTAPGFVTNTYVCNLTPARPEDIFNRLIIAVSDDPVNKRLSLLTVEVPLTEMATNASVSISSDSRLLDTGSGGGFTQMLPVSGTIPFPRTGYSFDGLKFRLKNADGFDVVNLELEEQSWWFTPSLQAGLEISGARLNRLEVIARGQTESASIWKVDFLLAGVAAEATLFDLPESLELKKWLLIGYVGPIPVFASLGFDVQLTARAEVHSTLTFRAGQREISNAAFGLAYTTAGVRWVNIFNFPPPDLIPFSGNINAQGSLQVSLKPTVEFLVYGLAGVSAAITPSAAVVFDVGTGQALSGRMTAAVTLNLDLAGPAFEALSPKPAISVPLWSDEWHLFPAEPELRFILQPESQTLVIGGSAYFSCTVAAPESPAYQWYFDNVPLLGETSRTLLIPVLTLEHAGNYHVRAAAGNRTTNSNAAALTVITDVASPNMALIPAGAFAMGDTLGYTNYNPFSRPVHTVYVSAFYMDRYEVTKALWDDVFRWSTNHGYSFADIGYGKAADHPVHSINWHDAARWCNARSEKEGLRPCYYQYPDSFVSNYVYRGASGALQNSSVDWTANGYRLPTEAEWEKAARGGHAGGRFPGGDTISHSGVNYRASTSAPYDLSAPASYHPSFQIGAVPYTSPAGHFAPTSYGLYDICGNLFEWCWDQWVPEFYERPEATWDDTHGPSGTSYNFRVIRGGSWNHPSQIAFCASRAGFGTSRGYTTVGFRCVRAH